MAPLQLSFEAIGTHWVIDIFQSPSSVSEAEISQHIHTRIEKYDQAYSRFRADSLVTEMSQKTGIFTCPDDFEALYNLYHQLYELTKGKFTPLIGNVMEQAGYDAQYSLQPKTLQTPPSWSEVMELDASALTIKQPAILDFGAGGKGYLIDLVGEVLIEMGVAAFCIDAGGDILHHNTTSIRIGLENPENLEQVIGVATLKNQSICASAGSRRKWHTFHHIIDPETLTSPTEVAATWVVAGTTVLADALATCLFLVPPTQLTTHYQFEYAILKSNYSLEKSEHFPAEFFLQA